MIKRVAVAGLVLSAAGLVGIALHEGYKEEAYLPLPNDKVTIGFGSTEGVKLGDRTTPPQALERALRDVTKFEGALKRCVKVPLAQHEYDAAVEISYNIGSTAFCNSTMVRKLNAGDYEGFCNGFLQWNKVSGRVVRGLTIRREAERKLCRGEA